jgi:type VI secretion system protein ImpG
MFAKFYQSELAYLREMGREFAAAYPNSAGLLSERSDDPDVERLLEGFAFLSAQIRERVDDAVPELVHGLAELLIPQALRPLPAMSIVEFRPTLESLRELRQIPRGRALSAKPIAGTACGFQTCYATDLLPLELVGVEHDEALARRPVIRLRLRTSAAGRPLIARAGGLRLFLAGELALASTLHLWLLRHCDQIELRSGDTPESARTTAPLRVLEREAIAAVGLAPEEAVLPWPELAPDGVRYVQEYFALPSKYLFVDVRGLAGVELIGDYLELAFAFERPPPLPSPISDETFRLHCTPVINLFTASAEPIRHDPLLPEQPIRVAGVDARHAEVYGVTSVTGIRPGRGNRRRYTNFYRFAHTRPGEGDDGYYVVRRSRSPIDEGIDSTLRIARAREADAPDEDETLSLELHCCNRSLPLELQIGDICQPVRGSSVPEFANITAVSAPVRAPLASELQWRLLAHLAVNRRRISEADNLRQLVSLYNFVDATRSPVGRANALRVEAIRATEFSAITRMLDGAPVRGAETTVELDETRFASLGDAHLFGLVLDELLASYCGINSYQQLRVRLYPSKAEWRWAPRSGRQRIV